VCAADLQKAVAHLHAGHADDQKVRVALFQKHFSARLSAYRTTPLAALLANHRAELANDS